jgi:hypothetical protein
MTSAGQKLLLSHEGGCDWLDEGTLAEWITEIEQEAVDIFRGECLMVGIDLGPMSGETVKRSLEAIKRAYREYMGE